MAFVELASNVLSMIDNAKWDGKKSILLMRDAGERDGKNYGYRQKEWAGFFFEYLLETGKSDRIVYNSSTHKGSEGGTVRIDFFDTKNNCPIDTKVHILNNSSGSMEVPGNDMNTMSDAINRYGHVEYVILTGESEYESDAREFALWQDSIKNRQIRHTSRAGNHRRMKTSFTPKQIVVVDIDKERFELMASKGLFSQGHNSNQRERAKKFKLDLTDDMSDVIVDAVTGQQVKTLVGATKISLKPIRYSDDIKAIPVAHSSNSIYSNKSATSVSSSDGRKPEHKHKLSDDGEIMTWVEPHMRMGRKVSGYWRRIHRHS